MVQIQSLPAAVSPLAKEPCLGAWQRATLRGNRAFERGDDANALTQYRAALSLADMFPGRSDDVDAALAALIVSHHNLLALHERTGQIEFAAAHACRAHELLHEIALDLAMPDCWREAAWRHARVTYAELMRFLQRHPDHDRTRRAAELTWRDAAQAQH